jgi:probable phosphoglycerate mutase
MELILVRHAQPDWSPEGIVSNDPDLTDLGRHQADLVARREWGAVDALWVSPMVRARGTAGPISEMLGIEPEVHEWLREIANPPEWEGSPVHEVQEWFATQHLRPVEQMWDGLPGGEAFAEFHTRVTEGAQATLGLRVVDDRHPHLWEQLGDERIVIVAHGGTNAVLLGHLLGVDPTPWEWDRFDFAHTAVATCSTRAIAHGEAFGLTTFGDVGHLPPAMITR